MFIKDLFWTASPLLCLKNDFMNNLSQQVYSILIYSLKEVRLQFVNHRSLMIHSINIPKEKKRR